MGLSFHNMYTYLIYLGSESEIHGTWSFHSELNTFQGNKSFISMDIQEEKQNSVLFVCLGDYQNLWKMVLSLFNSISYPQCWCLNIYSQYHTYTIMTVLIVCWQEIPAGLPCPREYFSIWSRKGDSKTKWVRHILYHVILKKEEL